MDYREVCTQKPVRGFKEVDQYIPGGVKWDRDCQEREQTKVIYEKKPRVVTQEITANKCKPYQDELCYDLFKDGYDVVQKDLSGMVNVTVQDCNIQKVQDEVCAPIQKIVCRKVPILKTIKIVKHKCRGSIRKQKCFTKPVSDCIENNQCTWVKRYKCIEQPSCQQNDYCNQCQYFIQQGGSSTCPTNTCNKFFPGPGGFAPPTNNTDYMTPTLYDQMPGGGGMPMMGNGMPMGGPMGGPMMGGPMGGQMGGPMGGPMMGGQMGGMGMNQMGPAVTADRVELLN